MLIAMSTQANGVTEFWVDDVTFVNCQATYTPANVDPTCNFESGTCGWYQEKTKDDFDWTLGVASDVDALNITGPGICFLYFIFF